MRYLANTSLACDRRLTFLGTQQDFRQRIESSVGSLIHFVDAHRADGMTHDQYRMIRRTERITLGLRQCFKGVRDDSYSKRAAFLKLNGVVDTPRRAGPSISQAADNEISLRRKLVKVSLGRALLGGQLTPLDHARDPVLFFEQPPETFSQFIRIRFAVIEQSDNLAAQL